MAHEDPSLTAIPILDFRAASIAKLIDGRGWRDLSDTDKIGAVYDFVRNEILFGYNRFDDIPASEVLSDGYGQRNTKGTLLMALLRAVGIKCRIHGFTIHKGLQRGVVPEFVYPIAPEEILHSWIEVDLGGRWINLEGFIIDNAFLKVLQSSFADREILCGCGAGTDCLSAPPVEWTGQDTYIQETGIAQDFGAFDTPGAFYAEHEQNFGRLRGWLYRNIIRHWMNVRVRAFRAGRLKPDAAIAHQHEGETHAA